MFDLCTVSVQKSIFYFKTRKSAAIRKNVEAWPMIV